MTDDYILLVNIYTPAITILANSDSNEHLGSESIEHGKPDRDEHLVPAYKTIDKRCEVLNHAGVCN